MVVPPMRSQQTKFKKECLDVEEVLIGLSEAHLFDSQPRLFEKIAQRIKRARIYALKNDFAQGHHMLNLARAAMHKAIGDQGTWWSFRKVHAGVVWIYYILLLSSVVGVGFIIDGLSFGEHAPTAWEMPIATAAYGMLGGLIRGMYWLFQKVPDNKYRITFIVPYVGGPWLASALGLFSYALLASGIGLFGEVTSGKQESAAFAAAAMMAGFSWEWFIKLLKKAQQRALSNADS